MTTESADVPNSGRVMARPANTETVDPTAPAAFPPPRSADWPPTPPSRRPTHRHRGAVPLLAADCLAVCAAGTAAVAAGGTGHALIVLAPGLPAVVLLNARGGLYRPGPAATALTELPALLTRAAVTWCVLAALLAALRPAHGLDWDLLLTLVAAHVLLAGAARGTVYLGRRAAARRRPHSVLVVGSGPAGRRVTSALYQHPEYGMRPVGLVDTGTATDQETDTAEPSPLPVLSSAEDITRAVIQNTVRDAVFTRDPEADPRTAAHFRLLAEQGCAVWLVDDGRPAPGTRAADHLWGFGCRRVEPFPRQHRLGSLGKRTLDITVAALALLATAPLLLACALAVRIADGPGVIFRQERIGLGGRPFVLLKFRTLRPADAYESATLWSVAHDRRMSPAGRLLRGTSLDELPQLWNVLRGDMSLVGPRPERPYFVRKFSQTYPRYAARHRMPVGITGLAQVHGLRGDTSIEDRARFDNHYIETWSLWQDVRILLSTLTSLFRTRGS